MMRPLPRLVSVLLFVLAALVAKPQKPTEYTYTLQFGAPLDAVQVKTLGEAMLAHDPAILCWADVGSTTAVVRGHIPFDPEQVNAVIAPSGAQIVGHQVATVKSMVDEDHMPPGFPVMPNTGDPQADQAAYETAKAAWIQAHPEEYQQLIAPH